MRLHALWTWISGFLTTTAKDTADVYFFRTENMLRPVVTTSSITAMDEPSGIY